MTPVITNNSSTRRVGTHGVGTIILVVALMVLQGCTAMSRPRAVPDDPQYAPVRAEAMMQRDPESGAIYQSSRNHNLYGDTVALNVGDILTVTLEESTRASKNAESSVTKDNEISILDPRILGRANLDLGTEIDLERDFQGQAEAEQQPCRQHHRDGHGSAAQWGTTHPR